jgi:hypothetical protein
MKSKKYIGTADLEAESFKKSGKLKLNGRDAKQKELISKPSSFAVDVFFKQKLRVAKQN